MSETKADRGICKYFIFDKCQRGDECKWTHTKNQCNNEQCDTYTTHPLCFSCNKKEKAMKKAEYEKRVREEGRPCKFNYDPQKKKKGSCENYTFGDYCDDCGRIAGEYLITTCRKRGCANRIKGFNGFCDSCKN